MSGFSAGWLALREPADVAARSVDVTNAVVGTLSGRQPIMAVDLGSGTGSNVRYLAPRLPACQWRLVDHDPHLLAVAQTMLLNATASTIETRVSDLRVLDDSVLDGCDVVTASALLDLVSESWLVHLVERAREARCHVLMALNYDGRIVCTPRDEDDDLVRDLVNQHQRTDKGFGPALGPSAGVRAESLLREAGYDVVRAHSDWVLDMRHAELQRQLIEGWAQAAIELAPQSAARIRSWSARRLSHVRAAVSHLVVGHDDVGGRTRY